MTAGILRHAVLAGDGLKAAKRRVLGTRLRKPQRAAELNLSWDGPLDECVERLAVDHFQHCLQVGAFWADVPLGEGTGGKGWVCRRKNFRLQCPKGRGENGIHGVWTPASTRGSPDSP